MTEWKNESDAHRRSKKYVSVYVLRTDHFNESDHTSMIFHSLKQTISLSHEYYIAVSLPYIREFLFFFYYFVWYNVSKTKNQIQQPSTDHRRSKWLDELKSYNVHSNSWNVMWKSFKAIESLWTSYWKKWQTQKPAGHTQATR